MLASGAVQGETGGIGVAWQKLQEYLQKKLSKTQCQSIKFVKMHGSYYLVTIASAVSYGLTPGTQAKLYGMERTLMRSPDRSMKLLMERLAMASGREAGQRESIERTPAISLPDDTFLQIVAQIANLGLSVWDHELDRDVYVSEEFANIHGFNSVDYTVRIRSMEDYIDLIVPEDREDYIKYEIQFALDRSVRPSSVEYRIAAFGTEIRYVKQISQFIPCEVGVPYQSLCLVQDVTKHRQTEADLSESRIALEEREFLLAQSTSMTKLGYCLWDTINDRYLDVSDEWAAIFGYGKQEFLSLFTEMSDDRKLIFSLDVDRYNKFYEMAKTKSGYKDIEYRVTRKDGVVRHVAERVGEAVKSVNGNNGVLITLQDISERKLAEAQIIQASKLSTLGEMAAGLAHEINQPLNTINLAASNMELTLQDESLDRNRLLEKLERIKGQVSRASTIIDHIRTFGRDAVESDEIFDLQVAVLGAIDLVGERLKLENIHIEKHFDPRCLPVSGHPIQMEQVVLNLINNSIDALKQCDIESRQITLGTSICANGDALLRVSDSGGGIPDELLPRLFEPFVTTKSIGEGTGLGLSISHGIIKRMGGRITARNGEKGAVFELILPPAEQTPALPGD